MNIGESQLKALIKNTLLILVRQQHSDFNSDRYQCQNGIDCHDDHNDLIDRIAEEYKEYATISDYISQLQVSVQHKSIYEKTVFIPDVALIDD
jgi:hypothetical protein